jgi:uncharacterized SAM-binding protein YcdF (DUF218 family)
MSSAAPSTVSRSATRHRILLLLLALLFAVGVFFGITIVRIVQAGSGDDVQHADAIVVFGAAEYVGRPSPVYRARLDHAFDLFERGAAPMVITTGGQGDDLHYSEGGVGREYLKRRGIPDSRLIAETQGADTAHSAQRVAAIMRTNKMQSAIAVSDAYHIFRIKQMMKGQGVTAYGDPRPDSWPRTRRGRIAAVARELASYMLWRAHLSWLARTN